MYRIRKILFPEHTKKNPPIYRTKSILFYIIRNFFREHRIRQFLLSEYQVRTFPPTRVYHSYRGDTVILMFLHRVCLTKEKMPFGFLKQRVETNYLFLNR